MDFIQFVLNSFFYKDVFVVIKSFFCSIEVFIYKFYYGLWEERLGGFQLSYLFIY